MKFVFIYKKGQNVSGITDEQVMKDWGEWMQSLGDKLVDGGNPFNIGGKSVNLKAVKDIAAGDEYPVGYSIIEAKDISEAIEIAKSNPMHKHSNGNAVIDIFEAMPM